MEATGKRLLGRSLLALAEAWPAAKPALRRWGLRAKPDWFPDRIVHAQGPGGLRLGLASLGRNYLSFELFWRGLDYYEPVTARVLAELARTCGTFLDVGANVGYHSLRLAAHRPDLDIVAFEPHPKLHGLLAANVAVNGFRHIACEPLAVSAQAGSRWLYLNKSDMSASLESDFDPNQSGAVPVRTTSLDAYLARLARPGRLLIKVDVEGHEPAFFAGARRTLAAHRPDIVAEAARPYPAGTIAILRGLGYSFYQISDRGLGPCATPQPAVRGPLVFLNCLISVRPRIELDALFERLLPEMRRLDLRQTSKHVAPALLRRLVQRPVPAGQGWIRAGVAPGARTDEAVTRLRDG